MSASVDPDAREVVKRAREAVAGGAPNHELLSLLANEVERLQREADFWRFWAIKHGAAETLATLAAQLAEARDTLLAAYESAPSRAGVPVPEERDE